MDSAVRRLLWTDWVSEYTPSLTLSGENCSENNIRERLVRGLSAEWALLIFLYESPFVIIFTDPIQIFFSSMLLCAHDITTILLVYLYNKLPALNYFR